MQSPTGTTTHDIHIAPVYRAFQTIRTSGWCILGSSQFHLIRKSEPAVQIYSPRSRPHRTRPKHLRSCTPDQNCEFINWSSCFRPRSRAWSSCVRSKFIMMRLPVITLRRTPGSSELSELLPLSACSLRRQMHESCYISVSGKAESPPVKMLKKGGYLRVGTLMPTHHTSLRV